MKSYSTSPLLSRETRAHDLGYGENGSAGVWIFALMVVSPMVHIEIL